MRPYLLLKRHAIDTWRELARTSHAPQYRRLLKQAESYRHDLPPPEHPSDSITYIGTAALNLGLSYLLSGDRDYVDIARRWIHRAVSYPHWGKERMPDHDLDAAWLLFGLGLGYDWLKTTLPSAESDALRDKLALQGKRLHEFALANQGRWWSSAYWQNHHWICYGGLATAAYALWDDVDEARLWAELARGNFAQSLALMPEDGSDYEGPVYWRYGLIWFLIYADLLQQQTGEDLHSSDFLRNTFFYRLYLSGPNLADTANFGDCHDRRSAHTAAVYARLAGLYGIGEAQWLYHHFYQNGEWEREGAEGLVKPGLWAESGLEFLWHQPEVSPSPIGDLPCSRVFPDLGLVAMRSSWEADGAMMAFKCGTPNGLKAWHSGQALNHRYDWQTISAGHDHPDANSFIIIKGDDYIAVDEGYSKAKLTKHHSALLIDGRGQYADGAYNIFRQADETWGARLEDVFDFDGYVYARGEAARAYHPELKLRQFTRETLFLDGAAVVLKDTIASDDRHEYQWLLQTDVPAVKTGRRTYAITSGKTACALHVLRPAETDHQVIEQEITANPTSAKPDWIIRRTQYALSISPAKATRDSCYFVILDLAGGAVRAERAARGMMASIAADDAQWRIGFSTGRDGILADAVNVDGAWFAGLWEGGRVCRYMAGEATSVWLDDELHLTADWPVNVGWRQSGLETRIRVAAARPTWLRFKSNNPHRLWTNDGAAAYRYDALTGMVWIRVSAKTTQIGVSQGD